MAGQFHTERVSRSTRRNSCEAIPAFEQNLPGNACQFVDDFQGLMGDDFEPDPLFFVECWTFGTPAAMKNFKQRRQGAAERKRPSHTFHEICDSSAMSFSTQFAVDTKDFAAASAAASAERSYAEWRQSSSEEPATPTQDQNPPQEERFAEAFGSLQEPMQAMTQQSARELLGVNENCTRAQIKAAYRRMASQWHPDRLECTTEQVRRLATAQMAAINEAYHLLSSCLS
jgi:hypothetical protein